MKRWLTFLAVGTLFATLAEFLFCVLVRASPSEYAFTLVAYPLLLMPAYALSQAADRVIRRTSLADLIYNLGMGLAGLMIEWFVIGNSPWQNPSANQVGMFAYWAAVFTMPRLLLVDRPVLRNWNRTVVWSCAAFSTASPAIGVLLPVGFRLFVLVWLVIMGYTALEGLIGRAMWITTRSEHPRLA